MAKQKENYISSVHTLINSILTRLRNLKTTDKSCKLPKRPVSYIHSNVGVKKLTSCDAVGADVTFTEQYS